jgi:hypothetical protein
VETEAKELRILKYIGFEEARWYVPEVSPQTTPQTAPEAEPPVEVT